MLGMKDFQAALRSGSGEKRFSLIDPQWLRISVWCWIGARAEGCVTVGAVGLAGQCPGERADLLCCDRTSQGQQRLNAVVGDLHQFGCSPTPSQSHFSG